MTAHVSPLFLHAMAQEVVTKIVGVLSGSLFLL